MYRSFGEWWFFLLENWWFFFFGQLVIRSFGEWWLFLFVKWCFFFWRIGDSFVELVILSFGELLIFFFSEIGVSFFWSDSFFPLIWISFDGCPSFHIFLYQFTFNSPFLLFTLFFCHDFVVVVILPFISSGYSLWFLHRFWPIHQPSSRFMYSFLWVFVSFHACMYTQSEFCPHWRY